MALSAKNEILSLTAAILLAGGALVMMAQQFRSVPRTSDEDPGRYLPIPDSAGSTVPPPAFITSTTDTASNSEPLTIPLQELFSLSNPTALSDQVAREIDSAHGEFLASLDDSNGQREAVREALLQNLRALRTSVASPENRFQLAQELDTALASWLSAEELTALREFREQQAFSQFVEVQDPQIQLLAPLLGVEERQQLLTVLFAEMPSLDGSSAPASDLAPTAEPLSLPEYLQAQRDALERTRQQLSTVFTPEQAQQAEIYLQSMADGVNTAARIFAF